MPFFFGAISSCTLYLSCQTLAQWDAVAIWASFSASELVLELNCKFSLIFFIQNSLSLNLQLDQKTSKNEIQIFSTTIFITLILVVEQDQLKRLDFNLSN
jgi:hypothetical protein